MTHTISRVGEIPRLRAAALGISLLAAACSATNDSTPGMSGTGGVWSGGGAPSAAGGLAAGGTAAGTGSLGNIGGFSPGTGAQPPAPDGGPAARQKITIDDCGATNPAKLSPADVQKLQAGGPPGDLLVAYPYDGTVFPRGLLSPQVIWQSPAAQAVYVHLSSRLFEYKGCLVPGLPGEVTLPQNVWDAAGVQTEGAADPYTLEVTTLEGGVAKGPVARKIVIAQATLKGSIYYDSYNSTMSGAILGGAVLRLTPGKMAELFIREGACTGCHTVSSNGNRIVAREIGGVIEGQVYAITPSTGRNPPPLRVGASTAFVGLSPDGSVYLNSAVQNNVGPRVNGGLPVLANIASELHETDTGAIVHDTGIPQTAMMPTFSPDGRFVVFTDFAINGGRGLATMRYDGASRKGSDYRKLLETPQLYPGWPFFLPDNGAVIFAGTVSSDFSGAGAGILPIAGPASDLSIVDVQSGQAVLLARAMGFAKPDDFASNTTYLPLGPMELHQSYYPTVSPVAAGGYFWVFFDSIRSYGSLGVSRQLWGTALTISPDGKYLSDPSHPAFYLTGQEPRTANHRAFTALDPCKADGSACESGVDCCSGYCTDGLCGIPDVPRCSRTGEACKERSDCCDVRQSCIRGFCSTVLH